MLLMLLSVCVVSVELNDLEPDHNYNFSIIILHGDFVQGVIIIVRVRSLCVEAEASFSSCRLVRLRSS